MWPQNAPPYPKKRSDGRPSWNSVFQCTDAVFQKDNTAYPRGNMDKKHQQYHLFMYSSLHFELKEIFKLFINNLDEAEDDNANVLYIERFVFMPRDLFCTLCRWCIQLKHKTINKPNQRYDDIKISKLFLIKGRKVVKWTKKTWDNIRGEVACQYYYSTF